MIQQTEFERELAALLVTSLNLPVDPAAIVPEAPLFRDGLGLDSIDMLEIALAVSRNYGVELRADDPDNEKIFASLHSLAAVVAARRG